MRTTAERTEKSYVINGAKVFITNGLQAEQVIICAKTDPGAGARGVSRFFVDARVQTIYAGTSEIMKEVIARSMLGK